MMSIFIFRKTHCLGYCIIFPGRKVVLHCERPWLDARCPLEQLYDSPPQLGRENRAKGFWIEIKIGRDHSPVPIMGKTDSISEMDIIRYQSNQNRLMRNKTKSSECLPLHPHSFFFPGIGFIFGSLPEGTGNGDCGKFITCSFCHSFFALWGGLHLLFQCGISPMGGSPPWASP